MAQVFGESQAWRSVLAMLAEDHAKVHGPSCISRLIWELESGRDKWQNEAEARLQQQIKLLSEQVGVAEQNIVRARADAEANISPQIRYFQSQLSEFQTRGNFLVRLYHRIATVPRIRAKLSSALRAFDAAPIKHIQDRDRYAREKSQLSASPSQFIAAAVQQQAQRLERLKHAASSPELAGASAELELATLLARLPDTYIVLHDVRLEKSRAIRFNDKWLKTAQCDHIVVGPTGVFVIESKRWSREYASRADLFDPFEQVGRARFLCQCILRDYGFSVTPRDIIANAGSRLTKPQNARGWICSPAGVTPHILSSRGSLDHVEIAGIVSVLRRSIGQI